MTQTLYCHIRQSFRHSFEIRYHSCNDNRVTESGVSTPTHAIGQNLEPFFSPAHLSIFGLFPDNKIPGRSLFRATAFSAVLPNFFKAQSLQFFSVTRSNVYHFARTKHKASDNSRVHRSLQQCGSSVWNLLTPRRP